MTHGMAPKGRSQSVRTVCTPETKASGNPQNKEDRPRTKRPRVLSSSAFGAGSGMRQVGLKRQISVVFQAAFIIV